MFGKNSVMKKEYGNGNTLHVVKGSPFLTIQGEGPWVGHSAVFIRLHGCHLRCTFCDTEFDKPDDPVVPMLTLVSQVMGIREKARLVVITGGEPMRQNILPLCKTLYDLGFLVQIETAGNFWIEDIHRYAEIVCSPKTPTIAPNVYKHAVAFKYIISTKSKFNTPIHPFVPCTSTQPGVRDAPLAPPHPDADVFLSPMDEGDDVQNRFNRMLVGRLAMNHGVIAGVQLHKFMEMD